MKLWQQVPTTDQLEEFTSAEDLGILEFLLALVIVVGAAILSRLVRRVVRWVLEKLPQITNEMAALIGRATGWFVVLIGIVWALVVLGIEMVPALMVIIIIAWVGIASLVVFSALKATIGLRVSEEEEVEGLDVPEHGMAGYSNDPSYA